VSDNVEKRFEIYRERVKANTFVDGCEKGNILHCNTSVRRGWLPELCLCADDMTFAVLYSFKCFHFFSFCHPASTSVSVTYSPSMTWSPQLDVKVKQSLYRSGQALGLQEFEARRFHNNQHMETLKLSALHTGRFYPFWYSFLLEAESIPGPKCGRKDFNEKSQLHHRESNPRPYGSSGL